MNEPAHTRLFGRVNQGFGVVDGTLVRLPAPREAHPIGVDQCIGAAEALAQLFGIQEIERANLDRSSEWIVDARLG